MRLSRLLYRLRGGRGGARTPDGSPSASYSLFGEILDWMLAPLLFLWPISIILTYDVALHIANQPYDQALADQVRALSRQVLIASDGSVNIELSSSASRLLRSDTEDTIYYQILAPDGRLLAGDSEVPAPDDEVVRNVGRIVFRDADIHGEDIRVASLALRESVTRRATSAEDERFTVVQVAETRNKRSSLSSRIVSGVLLPQFAIIPLAVLLVWFGLSRGIAPLGGLQGLIRERRPGDLSPIPPDSVPEEVRPLIVAFNDMMARLDSLLHAQQHFIADAAHQMRTPLAGLKMQIELAASEVETDQMRAAMQRAWVGAERAARLINQLLSLARAEASSENVHRFDRIDMAQLVRECVSDCVPLALRKGIDLGVDLGGDLVAASEQGEGNIYLEGSEVLLRELLTNLVDNAIKYTPAGGQVTVSLQRAGWQREAEDGVPGSTVECAVLSVMDNGPGIAVDEREKVFQRFYRVLGTGAEGSGLGLAIVREVAELHGGEVSLHDNPLASGLLVQVVFPVRHVAALQATVDTEDLPAT
ncbi:sensor histidine kinase N-terminal domain-containing protein [Uliginosibacterium sp. H3]|uniref:histidine kinase n=1 Tax=Uliginosibacterium silvisoli TaxID=3114758 RepID=A0ABU6JZ99_9RHOO|nr:sensor histidine kinase N-terminal domain-containing protein [Uliginosibacterium sp. H3]